MQTFPVTNWSVIFNAQLEKGKLVIDVDGKLPWDKELIVNSSAHLSALIALLQRPGCAIDANGNLSVTQNN